MLLLRKDTWVPADVRVMTANDLTTRRGDDTKTRHVSVEAEVSSQTAMNCVEEANVIVCRVEFRLICRLVWLFNVSSSVCSNFPTVDFPSPNTFLSS